jgi:hypothetical protein
VKIFGREPAQWVGVISAGLMVLTGTVLPLSNGQIDAVHMLLGAVAAALTAAAVRPLAVSVFQQVVKALFVVFVVFGIDVSVELQTAMLFFTEAIFNFALRPSVTPVADPRPL